MLMLFAEISAILSELENDLDETQSLKLRLIEEEKRHRTTKKELDEMKRNSVVFSDSSSSGLYPDYDSNPSDGEESEYTIFSPRVVLDNVASGDEDNSPLSDDQTQGELQNAGPLLAKTEDFEWEDEDGWRKFGSVDSLDTLSGKKVKNGLFNSLWKSSSLGRLNERGQDSGMAKRSSEKRLKQKINSPGSLNRGKKDKKQLESLEDKVAILEKQLQDEKRRRENSEHEVAQLQLEKEGLYLKLEDTRDQLRESQLNLFYEGDDYEEELCFEQGGNDNESTGFCGAPNQLAVPLERKHQFPSTDSEITAARCGSPGLNKLQSQTEHLRRTRLTASWRSLNAHFYELDEYDDEITVELDPSNILDTLRRLKTHTNALYNDVLNERDELRYLKKRASRLESS